MVPNSDLITNQPEDPPDNFNQCCSKNADSSYILKQLEVQSEPSVHSPSLSSTASSSPINHSEPIQSVVSDTGTENRIPATENGMRTDASQLYFGGTYQKQAPDRAPRR